MDPHRYGRVLVAWLVGAFGPAAGMFAFYRSGPDCDGSGFYGCRWGIDGLDGIGIAFTLVISLVTLGPLAVYLALRLAGDRLAGLSAGLTLAFAVPATFLALRLPPWGLVLVGAVAVAGRFAAVRIWR